LRSPSGVAANVVTTYDSGNAKERAMASRIAVAELVERERRFPMSLDAYLAWEDEGIRAEWVEGEVIVFVSALPRHVELVTFLLTLLSNYLRLYDQGKVFSTELRMRLGNTRSVRLPDIMVVRKENLYRVTSRLVEGPADLVFEFTSEDSDVRDHEEKYREFEALGVAEYVRNESRLDRDEFRFDRRNEDGRFEQVVPDTEGRYHSMVLPGFWIDPRWFRQDELPDPLRLLRIISPEGWRRLLAEDADES
jgi:Uma2 family endonuclease